MREKATLKLDNGVELRVELDSEDLDHEEIVVRRASDNGLESRGGLIAVIDEHRARAKRHPAGTTDRLLQSDRERPH